MDQATAYGRLNSRFIELAEGQGQVVRPTLGRSRDLQDSPAYCETWQDRWLSIYNDHHEQGILDPQWNGQVDPAHMQIFVDLNVHDIDILWRLRCAWLNFRVDLNRAEEDLFAILRSAGVAEPRA
jgi:hypothetical protein